MAIVATGSLRAHRADGSTIYAAQPEQRNLFDAIEHNRDAVVALKERYVPADYVPADYPWLKEIFDELLETVTNAGNEYDLAVECGDHARAFELVSWAHDLSVDMRSMSRKYRDRVAERENDHDH